MLSRKILHLNYMKNIYKEKLKINENATNLRLPHRRSQIEF